MALKPYQNLFWTCFVVELAVVDNNGNLLSNNKLFAIMIDYCINTAKEKNRLAPRSHYLSACLIPSFKAEAEKADE